GRRLEAHDLARRGIDHDTVKYRQILIAGERIFPALQFGMTDASVHEIHLADASVILLECRDPLRIWRPPDDGAVAFGPAGVVGGIAEIFDAFFGQLQIFVAGDIVDPEVPVANEGLFLAVR